MDLWPKSLFRPKKCFGRITKHGHSRQHKQEMTHTHLSPLAFQLVYYVLCAAHLLNELEQILEKAPQLLVLDGPVAVLEEHVSKVGIK